jgi:hypothetical protein
MENKTFYLYRSTHPDKKYSIRTMESTKVILFGAKGYEDFTKHKDEERRTAYLERHEKNEDWTKNGMLTAGFWSRWLLWNKPTIRESIDDIENRFNIRIVYSKSK